ncbi:hypothetical protein BBK36DRAFT_1155857 [Trichoderma citrinoviride]|uniref:Uncharacterized protein n=1 Tax=Trichoderma citrinoviride TaxID=58853 RepID=A0A2T4BIX4_9HYPO|nr:hypothetical protein BBK36DRAFT_1155857 [Trichoderma citrinoviride]PTB69267.1 hypothetical protein BBK36DRAFT_1155857 [Trichoderma citrinoviride]
MKAIPPRLSSRTGSRGRATPTRMPDPGNDEAELNIKQTPPSGTSGVNKAHAHRTIRSPLSDRVQEKRRAFEVTSSTEAFDPSGPEKGDNEARLPDLISIESDNSQEADNSKQSLDGKTPTKRRSVKALAAMFEGHDSPGAARKLWLNDANLAEGADDEKPALSRSQSDSQKPVHRSEAAPDVELHDMATEKDDEAGPVSIFSAAGQDSLILNEDTSVLVRPVLEIEQTVQELDRLVDAKSAEVAQLKLRVTLLEETDTDTAALRQQLNVAVREAQRWREKAEAAEKKARIFQKFTRRIRSIHSSLAVGEGSRVSGDANETVSTKGEDAEGSYSVHRVRFHMGLADGAGSSSAMSTEAGPVAGGSTETEGEIVVEEVDDGQELTSPSTATPLSSEQGAPFPVPPGLPALHTSLDGVVSPLAGAGRGAMDLSSAAMAMWVATQELLMMEDEEASGHTPDISTASTDGRFSESFLSEE